MHAIRRTTLVLVLLLLAGTAWSAPDFPALTGRVVDQADMLSPSTQNQLTRLSAGLEQATGDQLVVVTLTDIGDTPIETYGYQLGRAWGIGQSGAPGDKNKDNGVLLIVAKAQRAIRIEVGYGLEGELTDARAATIIRQIIEPAFKHGAFDQGVLAGAAAIVKTLGVDPGQAASQALDNATHQGRGDTPSLGHSLMFVVLMIAMIGLFGGGGGGGGFGRRGRRRRGMPWFIPMGGGFGGGRGGFGGGGGFSGGGGGFGGGGASGGW